MPENTVPKAPTTFADSVLRMAHAQAVFMIGWADAVREGYKAYLEALDPGNVVTTDVNNGLIQGAVKGLSKSVGMLPKVYEQSYAALAGTAPASATPPDTQ